MKHFKHLLCFLLVAAMTLSLCSCGLIAANRLAAHKETVDKLEQNIASLQNIPSIPTVTTQHEVALKRGNEVGNVCYDAQLAVITADGIQEQTIDPTSFGKVTVIYFWGTWCAPTLAELPYFDAIAKKYGDQIAVVAVHGILSAAAPAYIADHYPDSPIVFLSDYIADGVSADDPSAEFNRNGYFTLLGGRNNAYPRTIILNERGIITHIFNQSITEAQLETAVLEAMGRM